MQYESQPLEQHDVENDLRELMPYLFSYEVLGATVDVDESRKHIVSTLREKYGKDAMGQIFSLMNRLIQIAHDEGRIKMRLFPEPMVFRERRVAKITPHVQRLACRIDRARGEILESVVAAVEADSVPSERYTALLLLTLTLDDRVTGGKLLRSLLSDAHPIRIAGRPFFARTADHTVNEECIPLGYCSARVIAAAYRNQAEILLPRAGLRALYGRACTHMRQHHPELEFPRNVTTYLSALRHAHAVSGIPALVHSRDHDDRNAGMPVRALHRLISGRVPVMVDNVPGQPVEAEVPRARQRKAKEFSRWVRRDGVELNWPRLNAILRHWSAASSAGRESRCTATEQIRDEQTNHRSHTMAWLLLDWLAAMITDGQLQTDAVGARVRAAAALLGPHEDALSHYIEDGAAWELFYGRVAADDGARNQSEWDAVRAFHGFLVTSHGAGTVDWESEAGEDSQRRVDNNILSPTDYERARNLLEPYRGQRVVDNAYVMLILGYRLGLRFSEARTIEIGQVEDAADPWVHVKRNRWLPRLKSEGRRIPMDPMLPAAERDELLAWRRRRMQESGGDSSAALVSAGAAEPEPMSEARLRPLLADALSTATGDRTARYHHLRHSCATWLLVRLLRPMVDDRAWSGIAAFDHDDLSLERCQEFRNRLLLQSSGQEAMWVVSQILGHVSPAVTRRSYLRCVEWLSLAESWSFRCADASALQRLLGVGRSWAFDLHHRWGQRYARRATKDWPVATDRSKDSTPESEVRLSMRQYAGTGIYVEMVIRCECASAVSDLPQKRQHEVAALIAQWGLVPEVINRYLNAAAQVQSRFRTIKGQPRFGDRVRLPRGRAEQYDLEQWLTRLWQTWETGQLGSRIRIGRILVTTARSLARERSSVRFTCLPDVRRYLRDLDVVLGIDRSRVKIFLRPVIEETAEELDLRCREVANILRIRNDQVTLRPGAKPSAKHSGVVEVSVQAPRAASAGGLNLDQARRGSEAFRALVHYALVRVHELHSPHSIQPQ